MAGCSEMVFRDWHRSQCLRNAVVERDGKPYCKIHDPEYIKAKDVERQRKYDADNCQKCSFHFYYKHHQYCSLCGTKRSTA